MANAIRRRIMFISKKKAARLVRLYHWSVEGIKVIDGWTYGVVSNTMGVERYYKIEPAY